MITLILVMIIDVIIYGTNWKNSLYMYILIAETSPHLSSFLYMFILVVNTIIFFLYSHSLCITTHIV